MNDHPPRYTSRSGPDDEEIERYLGPEIGVPEDVDENMREVNRWLQDHHELLVADRETGVLFDAMGEPVSRFELSGSGASVPDLRARPSNDFHTTGKLGENVHADPFAEVAGATSTPDTDMDTTQETTTAIEEFRSIAGVAAASGLPMAALLFYVGVVEGVSPALLASLGTLVGVLAAGMAGLWYGLR